MIINQKTILALAAVATLAAALAPTSASAKFGRVNVGNHPVNVSHNVGRPAIRFGSRPTWHAPVVSRGHRPTWHRPIEIKVGGYTARPTWHRPIQINVVGGYARPHFYAPRTVSYYATYSPPTYLAPTTYAAAEPTYAAPRRPIVRPAVQVNGQNVMLIEVPNGQFSMTGQAHWVEQGQNGKTFEYTEDQRDEWSVYLTDASRGVKLQLDLYQKKVLYADRNNSAMRPIYAIVNAQ